MGQLRRSVRVVAVLLPLLLLVSRQALARPIGDLKNVILASKNGSFSIGEIIRDPTTTKVNLAQLFEKTTGRVRQVAVLRYGNFNDYWVASRTSRSGKAFEAYEAFRANRRLARIGKGGQFLVTAVEGQSHHAADLVQVSTEGKIVRSYQFKQSWKQAVNALDDPKYFGMTIVTHPEAVGVARQELRRKELQVAQRGRELPGEWRRIREALDSGQLTDELIPGFHVRTRHQTERLAKSFTSKVWLETQAEMQQFAPRMAGQPAKGGHLALSFGAKTARLAGKAFVVAEFGFVAYQTHKDVRAFTSGNLSGEVFASKMGLRTTELGIAVAVLVLSPEPASKITAFLVVAGVVVTAADISLDVVSEARRTRTRALLGQIDRDERFHAARYQLMRTAIGNAKMPVGHD